MEFSPLGSSVHGDSLGKNTGVGCYALLQCIFPTQGSDPGLPHCRQNLYHLRHQGRPKDMLYLTVFLWHLWFQSSASYSFWNMGLLPSSVQFISVHSVMSDSMQSHGLQHARLPYQLQEPAQIHVHWISDPIQPSCPLLFPSPPGFYLALPQGLFQWVSSSQQVAKVLEYQLQHQSCPWILRTDFLWIDWLDHLAVQGTLKSLLQHHSVKKLILWNSAFFISNSHIRI